MQRCVFLPTFPRNSLLHRPTHDGALSFRRLHAFGYFPHYSPEKTQEVPGAPFFTVLPSRSTRYLTFSLSWALRNYRIHLWSPRVRGGKDHFFNG